MNIQTFLIFHVLFLSSTAGESVTRSMYDSMALLVGEAASKRHKPAVQPYDTWHIRASILTTLIDSGTFEPLICQHPYTFAYSNLNFGNAHTLRHMRASNLTTPMHFCICEPKFCKSIAQIVQHLNIIFSLVEVVVELDFN